MKRSSKARPLASAPTLQVTSETSFEYTRSAGLRRFTAWSKRKLPEQPTNTLPHSPQGTVSRICVITSRGTAPMNMLKSFRYLLAKLFEQLTFGYLYMIHPMTSRNQKPTTGCRRRALREGTGLAVQGRKGLLIMGRPGALSSGGWQTANRVKGQGLSRLSPERSATLTPRSSLCGSAAHEVESGQARPSSHRSPPPSREASPDALKATPVTVVADDKWKVGA